MRMWEIRENTGKYDSDYRMGMKHNKLQEAYDCGYEDGYKDAMEEFEDKKKGGDHANYRDEESNYRRRR